MTSILTANDSQFKLLNSGEICFQPTLNNPLPGDTVAKITKGETVLTPKTEMTDNAHVSDKGAEQVVKNWLARYISTTLAPLHNLKITGQELPAPVQEICNCLHANMGIIHREELNDQIALLYNDTRAPLREKRVKMGPLLVFLPELNKPAAVNLKAVLWSIHNDQPLPAPTPKDGVVSVTINPENVNRLFFQIIGYPVFANRAIRIDMLDRVVNAVYDSAAEGKFQAQHKMAEWLGCTIDDLYATLRAMGHKQIKEPQTSENEVQQNKSTEPESSETKMMSDADTQKEKSEAIAAQMKPDTKDVESPLVPEGDAEIENPTEKIPDKKPELDWFWIKKGKASQKPQRKKLHNKTGAKTFSKPDKKKGTKFDKKSSRKNNAPKTYESKAKNAETDNPFSVLQQLKK